MLRRKNCVVTGGANGIGKEIVLNMARTGYNVAFIDLDPEAGKKLREDIQLMFGVDAFFFHGDICMQDDVETFSNAVIARFRCVDVLVNNGCAVGSSLIRPINGEEFGDDLLKDLAAPFVMAKMFSKSFPKNGCMINLLNTREPKDKEERMTLELVRESVISFTRKMAEFYKGVVRVNSVSPQKTVISEEAEDQVAIPFDVVRTVEFLCQDKADCINGQNLVVDGGLAAMFVYHGEGGWSFRRK